MALKEDSRFVVCLNNAEYPASLKLHKIYRLLPDKDAEVDGDFRVVDESDEDYLSNRTLRYCRVTMSRREISLRRD